MVRLQGFSEYFQSAFIDVRKELILSFKKSLSSTQLKGKGERVVICKVLNVIQRVSYALMESTVTREVLQSQLNQT